MLVLPFVLGPARRIPRVPLLHLAKRPAPKLVDAGDVGSPPLGLTLLRKIREELPLNVLLHTDRLGPSVFIGDSPRVAAFHFRTDGTAFGTEPSHGCTSFPSLMIQAHESFMAFYAL